MWQTEPILNLKARMASKLYKNSPRGFIIPELVENDTSFVFLAHNVLEMLNFLFFKMADSGHLGFKGQDSLKIPI